MRSFPSFKGQRNYPGLYWSAKSGRHVGFESWLERDTAVLLDFDPMVRSFVSQPFWLYWREGGRERRHAPDWFARLEGGVAVVIDCRPPGRIGAADRRAFEVTERACALVGWKYRLIGEVDRVEAMNLRWLGGYRHPRYQGDPAVVARLLEAFDPAKPLMEGAREVGDPISVLPVLYHLVWIGALRCDLRVPLAVQRMVCRVGG